eukprot:EG_transcript_7622
MSAQATDGKTPLPVIIAGAGPCGLLVAAILQRSDVPFIVFERAQKERHSADVGAGYDLTPTTQEIFHRLGIPEAEYCDAYGGMTILTLGGRRLRRLHLTSHDVRIKAASRSALQRCLLRSLGPNADLRFGQAVEGYSQDAAGVTVQLRSGEVVRGCALLGCDGIHSAVRRQMFESFEPLSVQPPLSAVPDTLKYLRITAWWGKCFLPAGSVVQQEVQRTQRTFTGQGFVLGLGSYRHPGAFMGSSVSVPGSASDVFMWSFYVQVTQRPNQSDDLLRRGAIVGPEVKAELEHLVGGLCPLIRHVVAATEPASISRVGLFHRARLDLPFTDGRVALLGDAAHPQTPFMGQGANMALTDAYICAERLCAQPVPVALAAYDTPQRREAINTVVQQAEWFAEAVVSPRCLNVALLHAVARWAPAGWLLRDMVTADYCNRDALRFVTLDLGLKSPPQNLSFASADPLNRSFACRAAELAAEVEAEAQGTPVGPGEAVAQPSAPDGPRGV